MQSFRRAGFGAQSLSLLLQALINRHQQESLRQAEACAGMPWTAVLLSCVSAGADAVQVTEGVFKAAGGRLKVVGRAGVGVDNVDLASATDMPPNMALHL